MIRRRKSLRLVAQSKTGMDEERRQARKALEE